MSFHNLDFYKGHRTASPTNYYITDLLSMRGDYGFLENNHNYIQWLFPIRTQGTNPYSYPTNSNEIHHFRNDGLAMSRFIMAFKVMLDFYGLRILDFENGNIGRKPNWAARAHNIVVNPHNNLRITRILKCLGLMKLHKFQIGFVNCLINGYNEGYLPGLKHSIEEFFIPAANSQ